jgi:hypothetical protein
MAKLLRIHCTHHKGGWTWAQKVFSNYAKQHKLKFAELEAAITHNMAGWRDELLKWPVSGLIARPRLDIALTQMGHDCDVADRPWLATHMYRDPRDMCVSGYFYHQWCAEDWANTPHPHWGGRSYKACLCELSKEDGLLFELKYQISVACLTLTRWQHWDDKRVLNIKYEDAIFEPSAAFERIFAHLQLPASAGARLGYKHSFVGNKKRQLGIEQRGKHMRKGVPGDWRNHFTPAVKDAMKEQWGDLLIQLGYEENHDW